MAKSKKVSDFLTGIRDPALVTAKSVVLGNATKLDDFEECQQYFSTIVSNLSNQAKAERHVAFVGTAGGGGGGSLVDQIKGGTYTDEQFRSLTPEEKKRVQKLRNEEKNKRKGNKDKRKERRRRKAARLKSEHEDASGEDDTTPEATSNAGSQFGSNGNRNKKQKN